MMWMFRPVGYFQINFMIIIWNLHVGTELIIIKIKHNFKKENDIHYKPQMNDSEGQSIV